jgi:plastocyanin
VVFVENASFPTTPNNGTEPKVLTVMIGVNNTVTWVNEDTIPHGFPIPDDENVNPDFAKFIAQKYDENGFIMPKHSFEYTFTHPGLIDYHWYHTHK